MKKIFKLSNLIPLLLVVYITKSFIVSPSLFDFGVIFLMSLSFIYKLKSDKDELSDKEELEDIISQLDTKVNDKILELQKIVNDDRLAAENKFSTLNLGLKQQSITKKQPNKVYNGWGQ